MGLNPFDGGHDAGSDGGTDGGDSKATWTKPAGYASVTFFVDDTANRTYSGAEIRWMGTFIYDPDTNVITHDPNWGVVLASYPPLYDDGPISNGGHEMPGASAGDHIFSAEVYVQAKPDQELQYKYGAINAEGNWIWTGPNGEFKLPAGSSERIDADGFFIRAFGTYDLKLTLDTLELNQVSWPFDPNTDELSIRGSMNAWTARVLFDDGDFENSGDAVAGDGVFTYLHSANLGAHDGLLSGEQRVHFAFWINGREYLKADLIPAGVSAWTNCAGEFEPSSLIVEPGDRTGNPYPTTVVCESGGRLPVGPVVPSQGPVAGGSLVSIYGSGFTPEALVTFAGRPAEGFEWISAEQINCYSPMGQQGPVAVRVALPDGEFGEAEAAFTYISRLGPELRHLMPAHGPSAGGTPVTLSGVNFADGITIWFGGLAAEGNEWNGPGLLRCLAPAHPAGTVSVSVNNPDGSLHTLEQAFSFEDAPLMGVEWASLMDPASVMLRPGEQSPIVSALIYEPELTLETGCHPDLLVDLGLGPPGTDPTLFSDDWTWTPASCAVNCENCPAADLYQGVLSADLPGHYSFAFRVSRDQGETWIPIDRGAGSRDGFQAEMAGLLIVTQPGSDLLVREIAPPAGSVMGTTPFTIRGEGFVPDTLVYLDEELVQTELLDWSRLLVSPRAHAAGTVDLLVVAPEPDYQEVPVLSAYTFVLSGSPTVDGNIEQGPEAEWPQQLQVAYSEAASSWGPNQLEALWVATDEQALYLAVAGWVDPSADNAVVVYLDLDYGTGTGISDMNQLVDELGHEDTPGLDGAVSSRFRVSDEAFGAEYALGSAGMASLALDENDPQLRSQAGLRGLGDGTAFTWPPAVVQTTALEPGLGAIEFAVPWSSLYANGSPEAGARLAVFVRIVSRDGEYAASASLPEDEAAIGHSVSRVFAFDLP